MPPLPPISSIAQNLIGGQSPSTKIRIPNTGAAIIFTALHLNKTIKFFPYDFEFDDSFKPEWSSEEAFGRMDPIMIYKRTSREATVTFNVVAENSDSGEGSAEYNFDQLKTFLQCLYPTYEGIVDTIVSGGPTTPPPPAPPRTAASSITSPATASTAISYGAQVIKASPVFKVSFMNLLSNDNYVIAITNFKHKFKFESGGTSLKGNKVVPGEFNLSISFKILHTKNPSEIVNYR